jgi:NitT/TauT family transport system permease protein
VTTLAPEQARPAAHPGRVANLVLPVLGVLAVIALWWLATIAFSIREFLLPSPADVAAEFGEHPGYLLEQSWVTLLETVQGFGLAIVVGIPIALLIAGSTIVERTIYPLLLALNSVPKIAIAPLLVIWMGFGPAPKVFLAFLVCFFPVVIATASGLKSTPAELVELLRSLDCSRRQEFFKLRFQYALPQIFVGLKVAISLAVIGAVVAEFSPGADAGLGFVITTSGSTANTSLAFAAITLLGVMSIALFYALVYVERRMLPWAQEHRAASVPR